MAHKIVLWKLLTNPEFWILNDEVKNTMFVYILFIGFFFLFSNLKTDISKGKMDGYSVFINNQKKNSLFLFNTVVMATQSCLEEPAAASSSLPWTY